MAAIKRFPGIDPAGKAICVTIASGPVIIENGKVLLDKHGEDKFWKFPGGTIQDGMSLLDNAKREVKEELGIDVLLQDDPLFLSFTREKDGSVEHVLLVHYKAKRLSKTITPGRDVREYCWAPIDDLPADCAPNIKAVVDKFR
jgi:8-oxo-dGTP pyrophosphatase MutT (NUDIX family)